MKDYIYFSLTDISEKDTFFGNISRSDLTEHALANKEAILCKSGALATWTESVSTGRSPKDTYIVKNDESSKNIDWMATNNIQLDSKIFDSLIKDALEVLKNDKQVYVTDRVVGADSSYSLPVKTITNKALSALFTENMFREIPDDIKNSIFADEEFILIALPDDKIDVSKYDSKLRKIGGKTSNMIVAVDFDRKIGLVYGSGYCGSIKKMLFTTMNYLLPERGILPLHCSANEGSKKDIALFLGLSGTGKTTLSADPARKLLGDDEHGWSDRGIANFENGCYAKLINLNPKKEPEIFKAVFGERPYREHGAIIENAMIYPNGSYDLDDSRFTENSRTSYPLSSLSNIKISSTGDHPKYIIFLTADGSGVLPPVAKLDENKAMLWFLMGYTSKLAGTETGITTPIPTFSRFFGAPFMPRLPEHYADLLKNNMQKHGTKVYLVNTGWTGGPYGVGKRFDINITRSIIDSILEGGLDNVEVYTDELFKLDIPKECPNIPSDILRPSNTWNDKDAYKKAANKLAEDFSKHFDSAYGMSGLSDDVKNSCPSL